MRNLPDSGIPRENHDRGLPLAIMRCESRDMLQDRVRAVQETIMHEPRYLRHQITQIRPKAEGDAISVTASYSVIEVLQDQVNPAIASHGGAINLVDVRGTEIYLEMSGGCQGCAMSRLTLRQGVERMLRQAIPELTAVHDITDHASGANPYFEA